MGGGEGTMGVVQTVSGRIDAANLGATMTHEHLLWDQRCWWPGDPEELGERAMAHAPVSMETLGWVHYHAHRSLDNIQQWDVGVAIEEASHFKRAGGGTIVDVSSLGIGRDPRALLQVSAATGLNVVMGSGYYIASSQPESVKAMDVPQIRDLILREFAEGAGDTGIRPGVIGEIGVSDFENPHERKMLSAAAAAQKALGCALFIHPPIWETRGLEILDLLESSGADPRRVVMCHCDPTLDKPDYHDAIARRGAFIEYDQFGIEFVGVEGIFLPRDLERIRAIKGQIDRGNLPHILVSQDVCFKICLVRYGGWGYAHILRDIVPFMVKEGISRQDIEAILTANPARMLSQSP
jgi:phosphotriesterase-related protein